MASREAVHTLASVLWTRRGAVSYKQPFRRSSRITDTWVRQHILKFTFTQSGDFLCPLYTSLSQRRHRPSAHECA